MNFNRPSADDFSPVERAILRGLGVERLDFRPTRPRLLIPFGGLGVRTAEQRVYELEQLDAEKEAMAAGGLVWDPAYDERQWGISREEVHERSTPAVSRTENLVPLFRPRQTFAATGPCVRLADETQVDVRAPRPRAPGEAVAK